jgi:hypothetical protein
MNRTQLEHVIRAAGAIAEADAVIIFESQAILGSIPDPPAHLTVSMEVDLYPQECPDRADLIDGSIGEDSMFHETFGYFAHGIGPETAILPKGWESRLVPIQNENTNGITGFCLSLPDIVISKLIAGREKDLEYAEILFKDGYVTITDVGSLSTTVPTEYRDILKTRIDAIVSKLPR